MPILHNHRNLTAPHTHRFCKTGRNAVNASSHCVGLHRAYYLLFHKLVCVATTACRSVESPGYFLFMAACDVAFVIAGVAKDAGF